MIRRRDHLRPLSFAAGLLACLAAISVPTSPALAADDDVRTEPLGVVVRDGDRVRADIDTFTDVDRYVVRLAEGGWLSVNLKAPRGSDLVPGLTVFRPDGSVFQPGLALTETGRGLKLKKLPVDTTGTWTLRVEGTGGSSGDYNLSVAARRPRVTGEELVNLKAATTGVWHFTGDDAAVLSFRMEILGGIGIERIQVLDPAGQPVVVEEGRLKESDDLIRGKRIVLNSGFGNYAIALTAELGGATEVNCRVKVRFPRVRRRKLELGTEPRPQSISPTQGRDGTAVEILGSGFVPGSQVWFGDRRSPRVVFDSDSRILADAAQPADPTIGGEVVVAVQNPDGQHEDAPETFQYLGIPRPETVSPPYSPLAGQTTLSLYGTGFRTGLSVIVGGVPADQIAVLEDGHLTCRSPAHAAGAVDIVIVDEFGRTSEVVTGHEYVGPPDLDLADPGEVPSFGGVTVTVHGLGFRPSIQVDLDGEAVNVETVPSSSRLTFVVPSGDSGPVTLTLRDEFGQETESSEVLRRTPSLHDKTDVVGPADPGDEDYYAHGLGLGDLDGDGDLDLFLASLFPSYLPDTDGGSPGSWILDNDGEGVFTDVTEDRHATFTDDEDTGRGFGVVLGDLDADDALDVLLLRAFPRSAPDSDFERNGTMYRYISERPEGLEVDRPTYRASRLLRNDGEGAFSDDSDDSLPDRSSTPMFGLGDAQQATCASLGDLDGDGHLDIALTSHFPISYGEVIATSYSGSVTVLEEEGEFVPATRILLGDGQGAFTQKMGAFDDPWISAYVRHPVRDFGGTVNAVGDLDDDGDLDLVIVRERPSAYIYAVNGGYDYTLIVAALVMFNDGDAVFELDEDALPDPVGVTQSQSAEFWQASSMALRDVDDDGDLDLLLGRRLAAAWQDAETLEWTLRPALVVLTNDGKGNFTDETDVVLPGTLSAGGGTDTIVSVCGFAFGDIDGDGREDIVYTGLTGLVEENGDTGFGEHGLRPVGARSATRILLANGDGTFRDATDLWIRQEPGDDPLPGQTLALGDLEGDGDLDVVIGYDAPVVDDPIPGSRRPLRFLINR